MLLLELDWQALSRRARAIASRPLRAWFSRSWKTLLSNALALAVAFLTACGGATSGSSNVSIRVDRTAVTLAPGETQVFTATVTGSSNTAVTWSVLEGAVGGTINGGLYTAPAFSGTFHVVAASQADPTKTATATVTVTALTISVSIRPNMVSVVWGEMQEFTASVTGSSNTAVTWSVQEGVAGGMITTNGVYTAPALGVYHVVATSVADETKSAIATITVVQPGQVRELWVARYEGPRRNGDSGKVIAVDSAGNVVVSGWSCNFYDSIVEFCTDVDYATIKYAADGTQIWAARFHDLQINGPTMATDPGGNVYVTGLRTTVKYDSGGNQLWVAPYADQRGVAGAVALDIAGNVYVTGCSDGLQYATVKYDSAGNQLWVAGYSGDHYNDCATAITLDGWGNVYVTGASYRLGSGFDYATVKYDSVGNQLWAARYNGQDNGDDIPVAVAVDSSANVYVTGFSCPYRCTKTDYATVKYDSNGNQLWVARYAGPTTDYNFPNAMVLDTNGNVFVTGSSRSLPALTGVAYDSYATVKYDGAGNQLWAARYNGPGGRGGVATAIALDSSGNAYVTGWSSGDGNSYDYATIKYDGGGARLWVARYNSGVYSDGQANAIAVDRRGYVYVTGTSGGDYATIKYSQEQ